MLANRERSCLIVVDIQPSFLNAIDRNEVVLHRSLFLLEIAKLIDVPILATEQYPSRMGGTAEQVIPFLSEPAIPKMSFSCAGCKAFEERLARTARKQAVLIGIETHICVNQTAHHLLSSGYEVIVAADAVGARKRSMHEIGLARIAAAGATVAHTESIAYEWLDSADDPAFREALKIVKQYSEP